MNANESRSVRPPLNKLSRMLSFPQKQLELISYGKSADRKKRSCYFSINNHILHKVDLDIKRGGICPECILDNGYIDQFWALKTAIACPKHRRKAITHCPSCKKELPWFRKGLLICSCGFDLSSERGEIIQSPEALALLSVIHEKLHHRSLPKDVSRFAFPLTYFDQISLRSLLSFIIKIHNSLTLESVRKPSPSMSVDELKNVSFYLTNWPNHFFTLIEQMTDTTHIEKYSGLTKQFENFYTRFIKGSNNPEEDIRFIRDTFIEFGEDHWKKARIGRHRNRPNIQQSIVGITGLAEHINVEKYTALRLVERGLIKPINQGRMANKHLLFELSQNMPTKPNKGESFGERQAAEMIGIPVSITKFLRKSGQLKFHYIGDTLASFHEFDIQEFNERMTSGLSIRRGTVKGNNFTVSDAMKMKGKSIQHKAALFIAIENDTIHAVGRLADSVGSIILERPEVHSFFRKLQIEDSKTLLAKDAAYMLGCDKDVPKSLVEMGYLHGKLEPLGLRIYEDSIKEFAEGFIPCSKVAERLKTSSKAIMNICNAYNCELIQASRGGKKPEQPFMPRSFLPTLGLNSSEFIFG